MKRSLSLLLPLCVLSARSELLAFAPDEATLAELPAGVTANGLPGVLPLAVRPLFGVAPKLSPPWLNHQAPTGNKTPSGVPKLPMAPVEGGPAVEATSCRAGELDELPEPAGTALALVCEFPGVGFTFRSALSAAMGELEVELLVDAAVLCVGLVLEEVESSAPKTGSTKAPIVPAQNVKIANRMTRCMLM